MEALILFFVLFFPALFASPYSGGTTPPMAIPFSVLRELSRTFTYTLPSLALLWYILPDKKGFSALKKEKIHLRDIFIFIIGLSGLIITGLGIALLVSLFSYSMEIAPPPMVEGPANIWGWMVLVLSCLATGYLEESYFRYYLLTRLKMSVPGAVAGVIFSTALFSLCHMYEGLWGVLNAILAGLLLSLLFIRFRSFHAIAWSHGAYNIFVYIVMGNLYGRF